MTKTQLARADVAAFRKMKIEVMAAIAANQGVKQSTIDQCLADGDKGGIIAQTIIKGYGTKIWFALMRTPR